MARRTSQLPTLPSEKQEGVGSQPPLGSSPYDIAMYPARTPDPTPVSPPLNPYDISMDRRVSFAPPPDYSGAPIIPIMEPGYPAQGFPSAWAGTQAWTPQLPENGSIRPRRPSQPYREETEMHHLVRRWMWEKFRGKLKEMKLPNAAFEALSALSDNQPLRALTINALQKRLDQKNCQTRGLVSQSTGWKPEREFSDADGRKCMRAIVKIMFNLDTYIFSPVIRKDGSSSEEKKTKQKWEKIDFGDRGVIWPSIRKEMFWPTDASTFYGEYGISLAELEDGMGSDEFRKAIGEFKIAYFFGITQDKLLTLTPYIQALVESSISASDPRAQMKEFLTKNNEGYGVVAGLILTIAVGNILINDYYGTMGIWSSNAGLITASVSFISALLCALISADNLVQISQCADENILWFATSAFNCWWLTDACRYRATSENQKTPSKSSMLFGLLNSFFHPFYQLANSILFLGISVWHAFTVFRIDMGKNTSIADKPTDCLKIRHAQWVLLTVALIFNFGVLVFLARRVLIACLARMASSNIQTLRAKTLKKAHNLEARQRASLLKAFNDANLQIYAAYAPEPVAPTPNPEADTYNNYGSPSMGKPYEDCDDEGEDEDNWSDFSRVDEDEETGGEEQKLDEGVLIKKKYDEDVESVRSVRLALGWDIIIATMLWGLLLTWALVVIVMRFSEPCHTGSLSATLTPTITPLFGK